MKPRFNITSAPLSTADLEEQRREYGNGYVAAKKRAHIICWILALVATVGLVPFYFLAANGATSENEMLAAIGAALIILVVLLHGATDEWVAMSASAYAGLVSGAILGA